MTGSSEPLQPDPPAGVGCEPPEDVSASGCRLGSKGILPAELAAGYLKGHSRRDFTVFVAFETQGIPVTRDLEGPES